MDTIKWLKDKTVEWNRIKLTKEVDGVDGWWVEKRFEGIIPQRMIRVCIKSLKSSGGTNSVSYYYENIEGKSSFTIRVSAYKGDNHVRVNYSEMAQ